MRILGCILLLTVICQCQEIIYTNNPSQPPGDAITEVLNAVDTGAEHGYQKNKKESTGKYEFRGYQDKNSPGWRIKYTTHEYASPCGTGYIIIMECHHKTLNDSMIIVVHKGCVDWRDIQDLMENAAEPKIKNKDLGMKEEYDYIINMTGKYRFENKRTRG